MLKFLIVLVLATSTTISVVHGQCSTMESGVDDATKQAIVDKHNELRQQVASGNLDGQPAACNMQTLQWDDAIAAQAQEIANTCVYAHVKQYDDRWGHNGQNIAEGRASDVTYGSHWDHIIQKWFNENVNYTFGVRLHGTGHYTQVVWGNTQYVGCGYTNFMNSDGSRDDKLYVCNYGPGGNIDGEPPYQQQIDGQPCACNGLC